MNECPHENIKDHGDFQANRIVIENGKYIGLEDIEHQYVHIEECKDCGEIRKEYYIREPEDNVRGVRSYKYKAKETYYTNGGNLLEKDIFGNWYFNGDKMDEKKLKRRLTMLSDSIGNQDVSDTFKELAHQAREKSEQIRYKKTKRLEEIRDKWN